MQRIGPDSIQLRPWSEGDLQLLEQLNDGEMTRHLGGPETEEKIRQRHQRYCGIAETGKGRMFVIVAERESVPVGSVGYWEKEWQGDLIWEVGWGVLPAFQGRGIGASATAALVAQAWKEKHRSIHAFPSIANEPSNAICRKVGFSLLGECDFEYPTENWIRCNDWRLEVRDEP